MSVPIIPWNAVIPEVTSHEYLRVVILLQAASPDPWLNVLPFTSSVLDAQSAIHVQLAPGICSVVMTVIFELSDDFPEAGSDATTVGSFCFDELPAWDATLVAISLTDWYSVVQFVRESVIGVGDFPGTTLANTPDIPILEIRREINVTKRRIRIIEAK